MDSDSERADPVGKAQSIMGDGASAPSPGRGGRAWTEDQKRAASERMKAKHADGTAPKGGRAPKRATAASQAPPEPITAEEEQMVGFLVGTLWNIGGPFVKLAPLDKSDELTVGKAAAPVIRKYMPMLGDWALEVNLLLVVAMLVQVKRAEWKAKHGEEPGADTIDLTGIVRSVEAVAP